jgi:hypothetical protein
LSIECVGGCVYVLGDDVVLGVESASFGEEHLRPIGLSEEAGFAGLLDEIGDAVFMGECDCLGVLAAGGVKLEGLGELGLGSAEIFVVEEAGSRQESVFRGLLLTFAGGLGDCACGLCGGGRLWRGACVL